MTIGLRLTKAILAKSPKAIYMANADNFVRWMRNDFRPGCRNGPWNPTSKLALWCRAAMNRTKRIASALALGTLLLGYGQAKDKASYQTTKLVELRSDGVGFCFVFQIKDIAYVAVAHNHLPSNLIVGDPMQVKITDDHVWVKTDKKWPDDEIKTRISTRERMISEAKLPTCSLSVSVH
jgi:hypothetical protein